MYTSEKSVASSGTRDLHQPERLLRRAASHKSVDGCHSTGFTDQGRNAAARFFGQEDLAGLRFHHGRPVCLPCLIRTSCCHA